MSNEQIFWDRLEEMPDIEAVQEINIRQENIGLENAMLVNAKAESRDRREIDRLGATIFENTALLTKLNAKRKFLNQRIDRLSWRNAVKANFGDEGYLKCAIWIEANR